MIIIDLVYVRQSVAPSIVPEALSDFLTGKSFEA